MTIRKPASLVSFGAPLLKDYRHASNFFRSNGYENSPRLKFLYHVYFTINTVEIPSLATIFQAGQSSTIGLLVKSIQLPQYKIDTHTLNQYNRKRIVQTKINYEPIRVEFHDDGGDLVRRMWYYYYTYYYRDSTYKYFSESSTNGTNGESRVDPNGFDYNERDIYSADRIVNDWGYTGESSTNGVVSGIAKPPFFRDIRIYGFDQHRYAEYVLINPLISGWEHDTYEYSDDGGIMQNSVTIEYETVKYYSGTSADIKPPGFADSSYYDAQAGSLTSQDRLISAKQDLQQGTVMNPVGAPQQAFNRPSTGAVTPEDQARQIENERRNSSSPTIPRNTSTTFPR